MFEFVERTILEDLERNPDGMDALECKIAAMQASCDVLTLALLPDMLITNAPIS